jgi:hypothetical protein
MGDFNFSSEVKESMDIIGDQRFHEIGGDTIGETMGRKKGQEKGWKPDKVIVPLGFQFEVKDIRIVGKFPLQSVAKEEERTDDFINDMADDGVIRTPSDHFAILTVFTNSNFQ